jgi:hypothetical protein
MLLGDTLDRKIYKQQGPLIWNEQQIQFPNKEWIISLWRYLDTTDVVGKFFQYVVHGYVFS